jgi:hypothetical protein
MKFSYELVVGACRAGALGSAGSSGISRVMKVPIRVYNNVAGECSRQSLRGLAAIDARVEQWGDCRRRTICSGPLRNRTSDQNLAK